MAYQRDPNTIPSPLPADYDPQFDFSAFQADNPLTPLPAIPLDNEFNALDQAMDETQSRLRLIQRDDGALQNQSVGLDQLKTEARIGVNAPEDWEAAKAYAVNESVIVDGGTWYVALQSHISTADFADDLTADRWRLLIDLVPFTTEAKNWASRAEDDPVPEGNGTQFSALHHAEKTLASKNAASASEINALASENAASASEINALASKNAASASEINALASKNAAGNSADSALISKNAAGNSAAAALVSKNAASASEINALASKNAAGISKNAAGISETNAANSAASITGAEAASAISAAAALVSENAAAVSEGNAANSENAASTSENNAASSEANAAASAAAVATVAAVTATVFIKSDGSQPAWTAPTSTTLETASVIGVVVGETVVNIPAGTAVTLPALTGGTDYTIYASDAGALQAVDADSAAPANERLAGGFHVYAGSGGINPRSLWDLNWRPAAQNPRAMALSPSGQMWGDIYLMDTAYANSGYSRQNTTIADDGNRPIIPAAYGGNGSSVYGSMSWWVAVDLATAAGKRLPFYQEFTALAYGVVERQAVGTDPGTTQHQAGHRSACGCEQITGAMWQWGADIAATAGTSWSNIAEGRGDVYASNIKSPLFGANWSRGSNAGSRASLWVYAPSDSNSVFSARGVSDHTNLQAER